MKLAIIGSRDFTDYWTVANNFTTMFGRISSFGDQYFSVDEIISGGAIGVDSSAARLAKNNKIRLTVFKPDWNTHGKKAGILRNKDIMAACDMVLAFWDGTSKGTANSLSIAKRLKKPTIIIYV